MRIRKIAEWAIECLSQLVDYLKDKKETPHFYALSPTDDADSAIVGKYDEALNDALDPANDRIKNLALAGPYGSGKSSILRTYQKRHPRIGGKKLHFLYISLASFNESNKEADKTNGENLLSQIELSILQQLFYRESKEKLPDSRLKRIKRFTGWQRFRETVGYVLFLASLVYLITHNGNIDMNSWKTLTKLSCMQNIALLMVLYGCFRAIFKFTRIAHNIKIHSLNVKHPGGEAGIELAPHANESILNRNLEEILYFFEATKYNVVVIEDLDRFRMLDIFVKLRELNTLINNYRKIRRKITFVYALCDELFAAKDRTKFFDLIIPVIPVLGVSNSRDQLLNEFQRIDPSITKALIKDLSRHIDEMRLLHNIINEYRVYHKLIGEQRDLKPNNLLALIVYKNMYPDDFVKLGKEDGVLYSTIFPTDEKKEKDYNSITDQQSFVSMLVKEGYIDENCPAYISFFYEGFLTKSDRAFLDNVKNQKQSDFNHPLNSIGSVLEELLDDDFDTTYILNYQLITYLFEHTEAREERINRVSTILSDGSGNSWNFMNGFIQQCDDVQVVERFWEKMTLNKEDVLFCKLINTPNRDRLFNLWKDGLPENVRHEFMQKYSDADFDMIYIEGNDTVKSFYIGKYTITQAQWERVTGSNPSKSRQGGQYPVEYVSWDEAQKYCEKLSKLTDKSYRLPTEAEWEYAARGGKESKGYEYSGSDTLDEVGWYDGNSGGHTHEVGQLKPNELGIYDMSGNVWEWCSDEVWGSDRVLRGGSWNYGAKYCRSADRSYIVPGNRSSYDGFRVVASAPL
ncbi:MAG: SUMF1/EgtB/PvdO family nonheme iron enzyme [Prevotellaceae bacterium]|jgi:hypothetical protein|nr:SUMF1/EgtB/PvdO family nonheme iron enzyme [Prevotellaceae bacterium]